MIVVFYHGTHLHRPAPHPGMCLTTDEDGARHYGRNVFSFQLDLRGLVVREYTFDDNEMRRRIDEQDWPGDTEAELARLCAEGVDVLAYPDVDDRGRVHDTIRILSRNAIERLREIR